jgi:dihydrofolate reductase
MFIKAIEFVDHTGDAALGATAVALIDGTFGKNGDRSAAFGKMVGAGQTGKSAADHDVIKVFYFVNFHILFSPGKTILLFNIHAKRWKTRKKAKNNHFFCNLLQNSLFFRLKENSSAGTEIKK